MTVHHCWVGGGTDTAMRLSTRTSAITSLRWVVSTASDLSSPVYATAVAPDAGGMAKHTITGLAPGTLYYYGLEADGVLLAEATSRGQFRTLPADGSEASFSFWFASCKRTDSNHVVYDAIRARGPLMGLMLGDLGYDDPTSEAVTAYLWQTALAQPKFNQLCREVASTYIYDQHDFAGDNSWSGSSNAAVAQAYARAYATHYPLPADGIYYTWRVGRVRFIRLDTRSKRSDPAAPDGTGKTMLGPQQKAWLFDQLLAATEPLILIVSSIPHRPGAADRWGAYATEFSEINSFIGGVGGLAARVAWLGGDLHALAADDGSNSPNGCAQMIGAALDQDGATAGGLYFTASAWSAGWAPNTTGRGQYGWVDITDNGTSIDLDYTGYDHLGTALITLTKTYAATPGAPADLRVKHREGGTWNTAQPKVYDADTTTWVPAVMRHRFGGTWT